MQSSFGMWMQLSALVMFLAAACLARIYAGNSQATMFTKDVFALLDPAWRLLHGQHPYLDFYSPLGPLCYIPTAFGLMLSHSGTNGPVYGQVAVSLIASLWAYVIARSRFSLSLACLFAAYVFLLVIAPFDYGRHFSYPNPAMTYNRTGYGLLTILIIEAAASRVRSTWVGGLSTGTVLGLLFFIKVTYFAGGVLLILALLGMREQTRARFIGMFAGFCAVALAVCAYARFDIPAVITDFLLMLGGRKIGVLKIFSVAVESVSAESLVFLSFLALTAFFLWAQESEESKRQARQLLLAGVAVLFVGLLILFFNAQERGLPLNFAIAAIIASDILIMLEPEPGLAGKVRLFMIGWAILFAAGPITAETSGLAYAAATKYIAKFPPLKAPGLAGIRTQEAEYAGFVDDGLALAAQHLRPKDTVMSLDFTDFYSYALRIPPAQGGATCLHYKVTFRDNAHVPPDRLFGSASIVMMPVVFSEPDSQPAVMRLYGSFLSSHFHLEGASAQWRLYRRNSETVPCCKEVSRMQR